MRDIQLNAAQAVPSGPSHQVFQKLDIPVTISPALPPSLKSDHPFLDLQMN